MDVVANHGHVGNILARAQAVLAQPVLAPLGAGRVGRRAGILGLHLCVHQVAFISGLA